MARPNTKDEALASLGRLREALGFLPAARESFFGVRSAVDQVAFWREEIRTGQMKPNMLVDLYRGMVIRYSTTGPELTRLPGRAPELRRVADQFEREALILRRQRGEDVERSYGSRSYFGDRSRAELPEGVASLDERARRRPAEPPRPSGLPTDRRAEAADMRALAERLTTMAPRGGAHIDERRRNIEAAIGDLSGAELMALAQEYRIRKFPEGRSLDAKKRWLADRIASPLGH